MDGDMEDMSEDYSELSPAWRGYIDALKEDVQTAERRATDAESEVLALRQLDTKSAIELMAAKRRVADLEDDTIRLNNEKTDRFEQKIVAERRAEAAEAERDRLRTEAANKDAQLDDLETAVERLEDDLVKALGVHHD